MKRTELRVGNLILVADRESPVAIPAIERKVDAIELLGIVSLTDPIYPSNLRCPFVHCAGIDLTTERLEALGFKRIGTSKDYQKSGVFIHHRKRGFVITKRMPVIEYVHQLQNIFYSLTGKELV